MTTTPRSSSRARVAGTASAARVSAFAFRITSGGVLAELHRKLGGDDARDRIGPSARRERHDHPHEPRRPGLRLGGAGQDSQRKQKRCDQARVHGMAMRMVI
jgi:hypothetical protein